MQFTRLIEEICDVNRERKVSLQKRKLLLAVILKPIYSRDVKVLIKVEVCFEISDRAPVQPTCKLYSK